MARSQPKAKTIVIVILKELETKQKDLVNVSMTFILCGTRQTQAQNHFKAKTKKGDYHQNKPQKHQMP